MNLCTLFNAHFSPCSFNLLIKTFTSTVTGRHSVNVSFTKESSPFFFILSFTYLSSLTSDPHSGNSFHFCITSHEQGRSSKAKSISSYPAGSPDRCAAPRPPGPRFNLHVWVPTTKPEEILKKKFCLFTQFERPFLHIPSTFCQVTHTFKQFFKKLKIIKGGLIFEDTYFWAELAFNSRCTRRSTQIIRVNCFL